MSEHFLEKQLIVIDDFYRNPDAVRALALSLNFSSKAGKLYPGREAIAENNDWSLVWRNLAKFIGAKCVSQAKREIPFSQGKFMLAYSEHEKLRQTNVHVDLNEWAAVIYLSLPQHCTGGLSWYRHIETGAITDTPEWNEICFSEYANKGQDAVREAVLKMSRDLTQWKEIGRVSMRYNRAVLFRSDCFHGTTCLFGNRPENGRLIQLFEFHLDDTK